MGLISFTNITLLIFFIYLAVVAKNFYDIFNPTECDLKDKNSRCLKPIPNWKTSYVVNKQLNLSFFFYLNGYFWNKIFLVSFKISMCVSASNKLPKSNSECSQLINLSLDNKLNETFNRYIYALFQHPSFFLI